MFQVLETQWEFNSKGPATVVEKYGFEPWKNMDLNPDFATLKLCGILSKSLICNSPMSTMGAIMAPHTFDMGGQNSVHVKMLCKV